MPSAFSVVNAFRRAVKASELTPAQHPLSARELGDIACGLRARVDRPADALYRLVGVGLSGFVEQDSYHAQTDLFDRSV